MQFLGIPVPDQPFPNVNDTPMMQKNIRLAPTFVFNNHNVIITRIDLSTCFLVRFLKGMVAGTWAVTAAVAGAAAYFVL